MHCAIIGNLQEKFKVSPTTSAGGKPDNSLARQEMEPANPSKEKGT
jgi:hypothetical protein